MTGLRIALTPAAPDLTKAIEKIAEVVPGFVAAPILEIDLLVGIPADKAEAALAEIERVAEVCRSRKEGPPVSHFYGVVADPPAADGSRAIILLGYASPYLYEAAERLLGPDRPVSALPSPSRLKIGSTPEPLTTAQIEAIGSLRFTSDDEITIACATLSLLGGDAPVAVILADEVQPLPVPPTKEGRVPLPEKTAAALAGLSEEQRAMLEPVLAAMVEDVGAMLAAVKPEPVADMGKEKMMADEAKTAKSEIARLTRERDAAVAEAKSAKVSAARPAVARFAAAQGVPLADSADEAAIIAAAEAAAAKAGRPVKGLAALDAVALADSLAPVVERQRLSDPPTSGVKPAMKETY